MGSLPEMATPLSDGGKEAVKSLNSDSVGPNSTVAEFKTTERMACVAQALVVTWWAKNKPSGI